MRAASFTMRSPLHHRLRRATSPQEVSCFATVRQLGALLRRDPCSPLRVRSASPPQSRGDEGDRRVPVPRLRAFVIRDT